MGRILNEKLKQEFEKEFNVKGNSIVIFVDEQKKLASYIIDSTKKIEDDYEKILKYYNK